MSTILPTFKYSLKNMEASIDVLRAEPYSPLFKESVNYDDLEFTLSDGGLIIVNVPHGKKISDYHPDNFRCELELPEQTSLFCLVVPELVDVTFRATNLKTSIESNAILIPYRNAVYVESEDEILDFIAFQEKYSFEAPSSELVLIDDSVDLELLWKAVNLVDWAKGSHYKDGYDKLRDCFSLPELIKITTSFNSLFKAMDELNLEVSFNSYDTYCDLISYVISQGKDAYNSVMNNPESFIEYHNDSFNPDFSLCLPHIYQQDHYPHRLIDQSGMEKCPLKRKADRLIALEELNAIDFDQIIPAKHASTKQAQEEALSRLTALGEGNFVTALEGFGNAAYTRLGRIEGAPFGYLVSNILSEHFEEKVGNWKDFP